MAVYRSAISVRQRAAYHRGWVERNRARTREHARNWYHRHRQQVQFKRNSPEHKEKVRDGQYRRKFGASSLTKREMYEKQNGLCAVCGGPLPADFHKAHFDHDHKTGKLRELVHPGCNYLIGRVEAQPELLSCVAAYLARHKGGTDVCI